MGKIVGVVALGGIAISCFIVRIFQFHKKRFLFNNAYLYDSKKERETMDRNAAEESAAFVA